MSEQNNDVLADAAITIDALLQAAKANDIQRAQLIIQSIPDDGSREMILYGVARCAAAWASDLAIEKDDTFEGFLDGGATILGVL